MQNTTQQHIAIGPEFFAKAKNDYARWPWALVREFMQNGVDAGSTTIHWTVAEKDGKTVVTVRNDGEPMDRDVLFGKLLSLGSSGKDFAGSNCGGFGKAKEILYFCWDSYQIHTGALLVKGSGATYCETSNGFISGTESTIVLDGLHLADLHSEFKSWCFYAQVDCTMFWNGEQFECNMRKGSPRRDLGFGQVYSNKSTERRMVIRMQGMPMFVNCTNYDRCVVVELTGKSDELLTSNRDSLNDSHRWELAEFVTELAVDKRSALKSRQPKYRHYDGSRLCHRKEGVQVGALLELSGTNEEQPVQPVQDGIKLELVGESESIGVGAGGEIPFHGGGENRAAAFTGHVPVATVRVAVGEEFVIKNETELVIPSYYRPDEDFSSYSRKLARIWGRLMVQMHRTFDYEADFAIGFIFTDDGTLAEYEDGKFGVVYYIAPAKVVEQTLTYSKSWQKQWKLTDRSQLIMSAIHEFLHGRGYGYHDEDYANRLTSAAAKVMDNKKDFTWCFK